MPGHKNRRTLAVLLLLALLVTNPSLAQNSKPASDSRPFSRPRLVLLIVIDQFRYDYLTRFQDLFVAHGFRRLMHDGAFWTDANYPYSQTKTAPGHTAIMTGALPSVSGLVGNEWIERDAGRRVTSVSDANIKLLVEDHVKLPIVRAGCVLPPWVMNCAGPQMIEQR